MNAGRHERLLQLGRVAVAAFAVKGFCLALFLAASTNSEVRDYQEFLMLQKNETRAERLEAIQRRLSERLAPFDGQFYLDIARHGYRRFDYWPGGNFAFFPLYPLLLSLLEALGAPAILLAVLIQLVLSAMSAVFVWVLAERMGIPPWMPVALLLAWPAGVFHVLIYTESLFLFLCTLVFVLNVFGHEKAAAVVGFLAGLTRPQGLLAGFLLLPVRLEPGMKSTRRPRFLFLAPIAGFLTYMVLLQLCVGSAFAFLHIQRAWSRSPGLFGIWNALVQVVTFRGLLLDNLAALGGILMIPVLIRNLPLPLCLFGVTSVLMPLATGTPLSMCRFLSVDFPLFLGVAKLLRHRPGAVSALVLMGSVLQVWFIRRLACWEFAG